MKSRISVDFNDLHGQGIEPIIKVELNPSDDPRDKLLKTLFQNVGQSCYLQLNYTHEEFYEEEGNSYCKSKITLSKPWLPCKNLLEDIFERTGLRVTIIDDDLYYPGYNHRSIPITSLPEDYNEALERMLDIIIDKRGSEPKRVREYKP